MDSTIVTFLVLLNDKAQAEVFFGGSDKPILLKTVPFIERETIPKLFENNMELIDPVLHLASYIPRFQKSQPTSRYCLLSPDYAYLWR